MPPCLLVFYPLKEILGSSVDLCLQERLNKETTTMYFGKSLATQDGRFIDENVTSSTETKCN